MSCCFYKICLGGFGAAGYDIPVTISQGSMSLTKTTGGLGDTGPGCAMFSLDGFDVTQTFTVAFSPGGGYPAESYQNQILACCGSNGNGYGPCSPPFGVFACGVGLAGATITVSSGSFSGSGTTLANGMVNIALPVSQVQINGSMWTVTATYNGQTASQVLESISCVALGLTKTVASFFYVTAQVCGCIAQGVAGATFDLEGTPTNGSFSGGSQTTDANGTITGFLIPPGSYNWTVSFDPRFNPASGSYSYINNTYPTCNISCAGATGYFISVALTAADGYHCACGCNIPVKTNLVLVDSIVGEVNMTYQFSAFTNSSLWVGTFLFAFPGYCGCDASAVTITYYWPASNAPNQNANFDPSSCGSCAAFATWNSSIASMDRGFGECLSLDAQCQKMLSPTWFCPTNDICEGMNGVQAPNVQGITPICGIDQNFRTINGPKITAIQCFPIAVTQQSPGFPADNFNNPCTPFDSAVCSSTPWGDNPVEWNLTEA